MANVEGEINLNHYDNERDEKDPFTIEEDDEDEVDNAGITHEQDNYIEETTSGDVGEIIKGTEEEEEEDNITQSVLTSNDIPEIDPDIDPEINPEIDNLDNQKQEQQGGQNILFQIIKKRKMKSKQITKKKHKHKPQKRKSKRKEKSKLRNTRKKGKRKTRRKAKK